jgi:hypothetical protein
VDGCDPARFRAVSRPVLAGVPPLLARALSARALAPLFGPISREAGRGAARLAVARLPRNGVRALPCRRRSRNRSGGDAGG